MSGQLTTAQLYFVNKDVFLGNKRKLKKNVSSLEMVVFCRKFPHSVFFMYNI